MTTPPTFTGEIHFHQQDEVSVFFESNVSGQMEMIGEIHLFVLFAIRQMSNLGAHADPLAEMLMRIDEGIGLFASGQEIGGVRLIRYPGTRGMKRFLLSAQFFSGGQASFSMKAEGFGLLWQGMGYYGPTAVTTLLRFLAIKNSNSASYLGLYRGREGRLGSRPPLPPNRTGGFPASGSPVSGFTS